MFVYDILTALIFAVFFSTLVSLFIGWGPGSREKTWEGFLFFFVILFLLIWAGGVWITPFGPVFYNTYWAPYLLVGIIAALLLAAMTPIDRRRFPRNRQAAESYSANYAETARLSDPVTGEEPTLERKTATTDTEEAVFTAFSIFFWFLMVFLIIAIAAGYWR